MLISLAIVLILAIVAIHLLKRVPEGFANATQQMLVAIGSDTQIYTKPGVNSTWTAAKIAPMPGLTQIAQLQSGDVIGIVNGALYTTTPDLSGTWTRFNDPATGVNSFNQLQDGRYIVAGGGTGSLYFRQPTDTNWTPAGDGSGSLEQVYQLKDGTILGISGGRIYTKSPDQLSVPWTEFDSTSYGITSVSQLQDGTIIGTANGKLVTRPSLSTPWVSANDDTNGYNFVMTINAPIPPSPVPPFVPGLLPKPVVPTPAPSPIPPFVPGLLPKPVVPTPAPAPSPMPMPSPVPAPMPAPTPTPAAKPKQTCATEEDTERIVKMLEKNIAYTPSTSPETKEATDKQNQSQLLRSIRETVHNEIMNLRKFIMPTEPSKPSPIPAPPSTPAEIPVVPGLAPSIQPVPAAQPKKILPGVPTPATQQGDEYNRTSHKKPYQCPEDNCGGDYPNGCPDMSEYIRKDSIPCWGCTLPPTD
jgi:hypothetical protein